MVNHSPTESGHNTHVPTVDRPYLLMIGVILVVMIVASIALFWMVIAFGP